MRTSIYNDVRVVFIQVTEMDNRENGTVRSLLNAGEGICFSGSIETSKQMSTLFTSEAEATVTTLYSL
jgi:hypothetical protein